MPAAARIEDKIITGHLCTIVAKIGPTPIQTKVTINSMIAAVKGDMIEPHKFLPGSSCVDHPLQKVKEGSSTVTIGGIPAARIGDKADEGAIIKGSPNVFIGG